MEKKKVWLVSHYAMPPHLEVRIKTIRYAQILQERGYDVLLVTASTIHNTDINLITDNSLYIEKEYEGLKYVHIACSNYKGSGLKRIVNMLQFQRRFKNVMAKFEKPDVIVADCNCINYRGLQKFAKKYGIAFVTEVRDLWPLSIVEYMGISDKNPVIKYLNGQEKRMYKNSDAIIFSMPGGGDYIKDKGWEKQVSLDKVFNINNGIDVEEQQRQAKENAFSDPDLDDDSFKVIYCGSIRKVNDVGKLVEAAELLKEDKDVKFLIYGDGTQKAELETYCMENDISNVMFKGYVDKKYIPYICSKAGVNIISVKQTGVSKYGVSWNKLFDYMNAGKPIISTVKVNYDLIEANECGISCEDQDAKTIADAIVEIKRLAKGEYDKMCNNAKNAAKRFDFKVLTDKLEQVIDYAIEHKEK